MLLYQLRGPQMSLEEKMQNSFDLKNDIFHNWLWQYRPTRNYKPLEDRDPKQTVLN